MNGNVDEQTREIVFTRFAQQAKLTAKEATVVPAVLDTAFEHSSLCNMQQFVSMILRSEELKDYLAGICRRVAQ